MPTSHHLSPLPSPQMLKDFVHPHGCPAPWRIFKEPPCRSGKMTDHSLPKSWRISCTRVSSLAILHVSSLMNTSTEVLFENLQKDWYHSVAPTSPRQFPYQILILQSDTVHVLRMATTVRSWRIPSSFELPRHAAINQQHAIISF